MPSITELVVALGLGGYLVARTGFCIHPARFVQHIPKVGGTKDVNIAKIKQLAPTHVIVNVDENQWATVNTLREFVPQVIVTHPKTPHDNLLLIDQMTQMAETFAMNSEAFNALITRAKALKQQINAGLQGLQSRSHEPQRVLYLIWRDPWMTVAQDTYISRMLDLMGWQTWPQVQGGESGSTRYPTLNGNEAWLGQVQRVLLSSEPYRFGGQHVQEVQAWLPQAKVQLVDGEMLSWYGSRSIIGLAYLAGLAGSEASSPA